MIRVLHIINTLKAGGAERFLADTVTRLDPTVFEVRVVCLFSGGMFATQLAQAGVPVKTLGIRRLRDLRSWVRVWRELREFRPQIVHTHLPAACWMGLPMARVTGARVRIGHLQNVHPGWAVTTRRLDGLMARSATTTLACCEAVRRYFVDEVGYSARKMRVVYNSVDLAKFGALPDRSALRERFDLPENALVLVCVAALIEQKGHRFLVEAMKQVRSQVPHAVLLLVGDGPLRRWLDREVERLSLTQAVRFLGVREDVPAILSAGDVFVLPSLWEGLPLALIEAGAAGLAAVATEIDGVREVVQMGETGLLVKPGDSGALAGALVRLLTEEELRRAMGLEARALVEQRFDVAGRAMEMQSLYLQDFESTRNRPT